MQRQMIVLAHLGSSCTKSHAAGWMCWFLSLFISSPLSGLMRLRDGFDSEYVYNFVEILEEGWRRHWQWSDKRSGKKTWAVHGCFNGILGSRQIEKGETGEKQSQEYAHHFLWLRGKQFFLAGQRVNSAYYCDVLRHLLKNSPRNLAATELAVAS
jgi:hypothetical protein